VGTVPGVSSSSGGRPASQLWLVRHGATEWSAAGKHTSSTDLDLVEAGVQEAGTVGPKIGDAAFDRVLSSPRLRSRRTAEIAGFSDPEVLDDLREWEYGEDEGRTTAAIREERPGWSVWAAGPAGGETAGQVGARADRVVELVRSIDGPVLAFSHGHFCRVLGARWLGLAVADGAHLVLSTASVSVLGWERDVPAVLHWNHTGTLTT
jgi:broad specificity phosphatase PhoE